MWLWFVRAYHQLGIQIAVDDVQPLIYVRGETDLLEGFSKS